MTAPRRLFRTRKRPMSNFGQWLLWEVGRIPCLLAALLIYRVRIYDSSKLPRTGAVLIVSNHQSNLDPPLLGVASGWRHLDFIARLGLFSNGFFAGLIRALNAVPIRESEGDMAAIRESLRRLEGDCAVVIFPEGSRTQDGAMRRFRRGAALLLKRSRCPVIPVAIEGSYDAWPRGTTRPKLRGCRLAVKWGDPISHDDLLADGVDAGLEYLAGEIDRMRLELRGTLREATGGRYPAPGPGDHPSVREADASEEESDPDSDKDPGSKDSEPAQEGQRTV